jgi:hypothetical protein
MKRLGIVLFFGWLIVTPLASVCPSGKEIVILDIGGCELHCRCTPAGALRCVIYSC